MGRIVFWNSVAKRRRSISDTFYDNGLATIKGYLEDNGHAVEVIDWAREDFFNGLTPSKHSTRLRRLYNKLINCKPGIRKTILGFYSIQLQEWLGAVQQHRLNKRMRELARELKAKKVRVFGIKIWYGEAFANAKYLIREIKKIAPEIITVAGGYHVTLYEENLLRDSGFDLGVVCEGEFTVDGILKITAKYAGKWNKKEALKNIIKNADEGLLENLIYRKGAKILKTQRREITVHSSKSIPRYAINSNKVSIHVMVESLGCDWGRCHFCVHSHFYRHYSLRDPEEIVNEIRAMRKLGIGVFRFAGSDTPPAFGAKLAQRIKESGQDIIFGMGSRAIRGAKGHFNTLVCSYRTLIEGGLRAVFMGGETGNDLINDEVMNKGVSSEDIVHTILALREAEKQAGQKVYLSLALIYPTPVLGKVTLEQVKADNVRLLKETMPDSVMITPPGPFLHTKWYDEKDKFGFKADADVIKRAMEYEYVLYKPPNLWPRLGVYLEGRPFKKLLAECSEMRKIVEKDLGIPTDISDEHFLMFYSSGIREKEQILKAKNDTMLDVVSCDYKITSEISARVNEFSRKISQGQ